MKWGFTKLHRNVVLSVASVILLMQGCFLAILGIGQYNTRKAKTNAFVSRLLKNDGHMNPTSEDKRNSLLIPPPEYETSPTDFEALKRLSKTIAQHLFQANEVGSGFHFFFASRTDDEGNIVELYSDFPYKIDDDEVSRFLSVAENISKLKKSSGLYNNFYYAREKRDYGYLTVYIDYRIEKAETRAFCEIICLVIVISLFFSIISVALLNIFVMKPMKKAFDAQKRFISDAGHELKTPIAAISANLEVLKNEVPNNRWVSYIIEENDRMSNLVKDLMYLAHSDAGREKTIMETVNISDTVAFAILPLECLIYEKGKELVMDVESDLELVCDERKIKQLLVILVDNAVKNSDKGDVITVKAYKEDSNIVLKVHNTGWGIAKENLDKIFERFYRVDSSRNRTTGGYGLGLSIASAIVNEHRGKISVDSEEGKWAEFTVVLPAGAKK